MMTPTPQDYRIGLPLESSIRPDISIRVDDADAFARVIDTELPYWPETTEWALLDGDLLIVQCPKCDLKFSVNLDIFGPGYMCACPDCLGDASATEDGSMPAVGTGPDPFMAADAWQEANL